MHKILAKILPKLGEASSSPGKEVEITLDSREEAEDAQHLISGLRDIANFRYDNTLKGLVLTIKAGKYEDDA